MIKEIQIKNFRTCKDITIRLKSPLMALVGKNASGKTNTLEGISLASDFAFRGEITQDYSYIARSGFGAKFLIDLEGSRVTYQFKFYGRREAYIRDSFRAQLGDRTIEVFNKRGKFMLDLLGGKRQVYMPAKSSGMDFLTGLILSDKRKPDFAKELLEYSGLLMKVLITLGRVRYYAVQDEPVMVPFFSKSEFDKWKNEGRAEDADKVFSFQFYDFYKNKADDFKEYKSLIGSLELIDTIDCFEYEPSSKGPNTTDKVIYILFTVNNKPLIFPALSDGTKRVLRLLFQLFYDRPSLMLIEEPESSIHWGLLVKLLSIFSAYLDDKQILISTHSEQILNQLGPEQLIYLYIKGANSKAKYITGKDVTRIRKFMTHVGPLGEYITSGGLEEIFDG